VVNAHERDPATYVRGMRAALHMVVEGRFNPTPLFTHVLPLARLSEAFGIAQRRPPGFVKALVRP
jgi:threonine dehydrogenase-like Zn-dependent dehydrogenase